MDATPASLGTRILKQIAHSPPLRSYTNIIFYAKFGDNIMQLPRLKLISTILALCVAAVGSAAAAPTGTLSISALSNEVDSDQSVIYYGTSLNNSLLIGNDGGAATGGIRSFGFPPHNQTLTQTAHVRPGRTKAVGVLYDVGNDSRGGKDVIVSIAAPDSIIRLFDVNGTGMREVPGVQKKALGDWSCLCTWRSSQGGNYFFLFGKKVAMQFVVRENAGLVEVLEVCFLFHFHFRFL